MYQVPNTPTADRVQQLNLSSSSSSHSSAMLCSREGEQISLSPSFSLPCLSSLSRSFCNFMPQPPEIAAARAGLPGTPRCVGASASDASDREARIAVGLCRAAHSSDPRPSSSSAPMRRVVLVDSGHSSGTARAHGEAIIFAVVPAGLDNTASLQARVLPLHRERGLLHPRYLPKMDTWYVRYLPPLSSMHADKPMGSRLSGRQQRLPFIRHPKYSSMTA